MSPRISLISLNVEHSKHLETIKAFLEREKSDVFCAQEILDCDIPFFEKIAGPLVFFAPMLMLSREPKPIFWGIAIFSRLSARAHEAYYYHGDKNCVRMYEKNNPDATSHALLYADVEKDGEVFRIGTTHFTWTPDGQADDAQRRDLNALFRALDTAGDIALVGDFNAPRGLEIFSALSARFKDNIPPRYDTSIEGSPHRNSIKRMVDGLFTTPAYEAYDVSMASGVSDHYAIKARVRSAQ
ncbi:MAG: endonuclease/exonuclease/phosphatase family protein [Parcubacteria group bacterium]|nr:endonuclease/exonuclease/phosphatase family protein [Parcubacteria group bacterium]